MNKTGLCLKVFKQCADKYCRIIIEQIFVMPGPGDFSAARQAAIASNHNPISSFLIGLQGFFCGFQVDKVDDIEKQLPETSHKEPRIRQSLRNRRIAPIRETVDPKVLFSQEKVSVSSSLFESNAVPLTMTRSDLLQHLSFIKDIENLLTDEIKEGHESDAKLSFLSASELTKFVNKWRALTPSVKVPLREKLGELIERSEGDIHLHEARRLFPVKESGSFRHQKTYTNQKLLAQVQLIQSLDSLIAQTHTVVTKMKSEISQRYELNVKKASLLRSGKSREDMSIEEKRVLATPVRK